MFDMNPIYFPGKICHKSLMTKIIYDDIEAVTSLLREKENDLELAAKIGQELLERNQRLEERVSGLEVQLNSNIELITQLRHSISKDCSRITLSYVMIGRLVRQALPHQSAKSAFPRALFHTLFQCTISELPHKRAVIVTRAKKNSTLLRT